jgi:hypothetical protein
MKNTERTPLFIKFVVFSLPVKEVGAVLYVGHKLLSEYRTV